MSSRLGQPNTDQTSGAQPKIPVLAYQLVLAKPESINLNLNLKAAQAQSSQPQAAQIQDDDDSEEAAVVKEVEEETTDCSRSRMVIQGL
ncbi:hypothetical protein AAF712_010630 [Marasmius tenuissimus]|uniref:Uncharacterized protein n=1 Tax=Marasmius tenuissimus TaxID=585030 RepID=A0ABR2ZMU9_9AGAR